MITDERKKNAVRRLQAIEGQARGLQKMIQENRGCVDILTQISSTQEALKKVGQIIMRNYLEICATDSIRSNNQDEIYDELMDVIYKFAK